jgi:hypothetical protein
MKEHTNPDKVEKILWKLWPHVTKTIANQRLLPKLREPSDSVKLLEACH